VQHCPTLELEKIALGVPLIATFISASGKTMAGDLPPSSSETFFRFPAGAWTMSLASLGRAREATLSTLGWAASAAPAVSSTPVKMLTTPSEKPASWVSCLRRNALSGVCSAGFSTIEPPAASAGAIFHAAIISWEVPGDDLTNDADRLAQRLRRANHPARRR
jgi:hypothetical protein